MTPIAFIQVNTSLPSFKSSVTQVVWNIFPKEKHSISQETLQKYHRLRHYHVPAFPVSSSPFSPTRRSPFHLLHFWNHTPCLFSFSFSLSISLSPFSVTVQELSFQAQGVCPRVLCIYPTYMASLGFLSLSCSHIKIC